MPDTLKPTSPQWHARQLRHRHNSFRGHARMMQSQCNAILASPTTTESAKIKAREIHRLAVELDIYLKSRIDEG